jgi:hypothetical protein
MHPTFLVGTTVIATSIAITLAGFQILSEAAHRKYISSAVKQVAEAKL